MDIKKVIEAIGSDALQNGLGVSEYSLRAARREGRFPSSWFAVVKEMGESAGVEVREDMFSFKPASSQETAA